MVKKIVKSKITPIIMSMIMVLTALILSFNVVNGRSGFIKKNVAWENISSFHIDIWRTPVYPLFIGITKAFFETNFLMAASIIQHIVFLISIWYFYKLIAIVTDSERIAFYISAF